MSSNRCFYNPSTFLGSLARTSEGEPGGSQAEWQEVTSHSALPELWRKRTQGEHGLYSQRCVIIPSVASSVFRMSRGLGDTEVKMEFADVRVKDKKGGGEGGGATGRKEE